jgi:hypothetical protein
MSGFLQAAIKAIVLIVVLGSIAATLANAVSVYEVCKADYANSYGSSHEFSQQDVASECKWFAFGKSADSIAYIITAIATAGLVFYTLKLGAIARKQTRQLKRTNEQSRSIERGYVQMRAALPGLYEVIDPGNRDQAHPDHMLKICVRNFGNTPATVTDAPMWYAVVDQRDVPLRPDQLNFPEDRRGNTAFLAAGEEFFFFQRIPHEEFEPASAQFLWVYGYVDYTDAFGRNYRSGWARQYKRVRDDWRLYGGNRTEAFRLRDNLSLIANDPNNYDRRRD